MSIDIISRLCFYDLKGQADVIEILVYLMRK